MFRFFLCQLWWHFFAALVEGPADSNKRHVLVNNCFLGTEFFFPLKDMHQFFSGNSFFLSKSRHSAGVLKIVINIFTESNVDVFWREWKNLLTKIGFGRRAKTTHAHWTACRFLSVESQPTVLQKRVLSDQ